MEGTIWGVTTKVFITTNLAYRNAFCIFSQGGSGFGKTVYIFFSVFLKIKNKNILIDNYLVISNLKLHRLYFSKIISHSFAINIKSRTFVSGQTWGSPIRDSLVISFSVINYVVR